MNVQSYIESLASAIGRDMELSETGFSAFTMDGRQVLMQWHENQGMLLVHVDVDRLDSGEHPDIFRRLLSANYMLAATNGSILSLDDATGLVGLCRTIYPAAMSQHEFVLTVRNLVVLAQLWKDRLEAWKEELGAENVEVLDTVSAPPVLPSYSGSSVSEPARRVPFWQFSMFGAPRHKRREITAEDTNMG